MSVRPPRGLKARFHDLAEVPARKPRIVELHFSAEDVEHPFVPPPENHSQQLLVHAPEFAGGRLLGLCSPEDEVRERARLPSTADFTAEFPVDGRNRPIHCRPRSQTAQDGPKRPMTTRPPSPLSHLVLVKEAHATRP
jgi:hypothetical protein